jgi:hypothetical protein
MEPDTLTRFIQAARAAFDDGRDPATAVRDALHTLVTTPRDAPWLHALHAAQPARAELYRDPAHGFLLLAHSEPTDLYRPPHDHGRSWVIYALQHGEMDVGTYTRTNDARLGVRLHKRDSTRLRAGDVRVYREGDIHDTRCLAGPSLLFRFTARDLADEQRGGFLTRYTARDGTWTVGAP